MNLAEYPMIVEHMKKYPTDMDVKHALDMLSEKNLFTNPDQLKTISVGCNDDPIANLFASLGCETEGYDLSPYGFGHYPLIGPCLYKHHAADWLAADVKKNHYHVAVAISSIEHFGLSEFGGTQNTEGDVEAAKRIYDCLVPGGYALIAVPFGGKWHECPHWRRYTQKDMMARLWWMFSDVQCKFWWTSIRSDFPEPTRHDLDTYVESADLTVGMLMRK